MVSEKLIKLKDSLAYKLSSIECIEEVSYKSDVTESIEMTRMIFFEMLMLIFKGISIVKYSSTMTIIKIYDMENKYLYHYKHTLTGSALEVTTLIAGSTQGIVTMRGFLQLEKNIDKEFLRFARLNHKEKNTLLKIPEDIKVDVFNDLSKHLKREIRTRKIDSLLNYKK